MALLFADRSPTEAVVYRLSVHGGLYRLSPYFLLGEFASPDGADEVVVHPALERALTRIREHFAAPTTVSSGYRSRAHNATVEGAVPNSLHTLGMAADIAVRGVPPARVASYARDVLQMGGVGLYAGHVHASVGREGRFGLPFPTVYPAAQLPEITVTAPGAPAPGAPVLPHGSTFPRLYPVLPLPREESIRARMAGWGPVLALALGAALAHTR